MTSAESLPRGSDSVRDSLPQPLWKEARALRDRVGLDALDLGAAGLGLAEVPHHPVRGAVAGFVVGRAVRKTKAD